MLLSEITRLRGELSQGQCSLVGFSDAQREINRLEKMNKELIDK